MTKSVLWQKRAGFWLALILGLVFAFQGTLWAAAAIKPEVAIPMHVGEHIGSLADAQRFQKEAVVPGDRLGHRGDAEDRVAAHRRGPVDGQGADRVDLHSAMPAHEGDEAGNLPAGDMAGQDVMEAAEPPPA